MVMTHTDIAKRLAEIQPQVAFRYCDEEGRVSEAANPNGSVDAIAGLAFGAEVNTLESDDEVIQAHLDKIFPALFGRALSPRLGQSGLVRGYKSTMPPREALILSIS